MMKFCLYICITDNTKCRIDEIMQKTNYNQKTILMLMDKYGFKADYIRKSIRGDRVGIVPDKIKKDYYEIEAKAEEAIKEQSSKV